MTNADEYEVIYECVLEPNVGTEETLPSLTPYVCRFCERRRPEATFKSKAHVLPQALGNQVILSLEECDVCNSHGSRYETDLAAFLGIEMQTAMMLASERTLKLDGRAGHIRTEGRTIHIATQPGDSRVSIKRTERGMLINAMLPSFRPAYVARALARMAVFVARPEDLPNLHQYVEWIRGKTRWLKPRFFSGERRFNVGKLSFRLARGRSADLLFYMVGFGYGRRELACFLQCSPFSGKISMNLPPHVDWTMWEAEGDEIVRRHVESIEFVSKEHDEANAPTQEEIAVAAYYAWLRGGRREGRALDDWLEAEMDLHLLRLGFRLSNESSQ
ncbi:DUF2934 domain-containing protein [Sorangium sp. So ce204]|uniref:DUF2934 domain-containing protein n=1 Tax=Sorangium sp. So ce204 TaxID=3133288 RepID=UPI003F631ECF